MPRLWNALGLGRKRFCLSLVGTEILGSKKEVVRDWLRYGRLRDIRLVKAEFILDGHLMDISWYGTLIYSGWRKTSFSVVPLWRTTIPLDTFAAPEYRLGFRTDARCGYDARLPTSTQIDKCQGTNVEARLSWTVHDGQSHTLTPHPSYGEPRWRAQCSTV